MKKIGFILLLACMALLLGCTQPQAGDEATEEQSIPLETEEIEEALQTQEDEGYSLEKAREMAEMAASQKPVAGDADPQDDVRERKKGSGKALDAMVEPMMDILGVSTQTDGQTITATITLGSTVSYDKIKQIESNYEKFQGEVPQYLLVFGQMSQTGQMQVLENECYFGFFKDPRYLDTAFSGYSTEQNNPAGTLEGLGTGTLTIKIPSSHLFASAYSTKWHGTERTVVGCGLARGKPVYVRAQVTSLNFFDQAPDEKNKEYFSGAGAYLQWYHTDILEELPKSAAESGGMSFAECNFVNADEISTALGTEYMDGVASSMPPQGCTKSFIAKDMRSNFFLTVRDYAGQDQSAEQVFNSECPQYLKPEIGQDIGDRSCKIQFGNNRNLEYTKGDILIKISSSLASADFDKMMEIGRIIEQRIG